MNDELEPDDELVDDETSIPFMFGKEPDYQEWKRLIDKEYTPLKDAICYAIGLHLNFKNRDIFPDWEEKMKEETYTSLLNRADADIISGALKVEERNGKDFVSIKEFYSWIKQQGETLNGSTRNRVGEY